MIAPVRPEELRAFREEHRLSQRELASKTGAAARTIEDWEAGRRQAPAMLRVALSAVDHGLAPWEQAGATVAADFAETLVTTERAIDDAVGQATRFVSEMIGARRNLNIAVVGTNDKGAKALEAIAALARARSALVACHAELAKQHQQFGDLDIAAGPNSTTRRKEAGTGKTSN